VVIARGCIGQFKVVVAENVRCENAKSPKLAIESVALVAGVCLPISAISELGGMEQRPVIRGHQLFALRSIARYLLEPLLQAKLVCAATLIFAQKATITSIDPFSTTLHNLQLRLHV
jgi:hypothetical protein